MEAEAARAGIEITFVQAIDGRELSLEAAAGYDRKRRLKYAPDLEPNQVACALSHKAALTVFLANDAEAAVILEDDAVLSDHFLDFVKAVTNLPIKWNAVNLENRNKKPLRPAVITFDFGVGLHTSGWLSKGSAGWLYSRQGAALALRSLSSFRHSYDTHIGFFWRHGMTPLCAYPPVIGWSTATPSTISVAGHGKQQFTQKDLSWAQFLRWRRERIEHEVRKEIQARIALVQLRMALARTPDAGTGPLGLASPAAGHSG